MKNIYTSCKMLLHTSHINPCYSQALVVLSMSAFQRSGRHVEYKLNHITKSQQAPLEVSRRITLDELIRSRLSARWEGCRVRRNLSTVLKKCWNYTWRGTMLLIFLNPNQLKISCNFFDDEFSKSGL